MQFNTSQMRAISFGPGPCLVLAGPGSGKTTVITQRIRNLIDSYNVPPQHILAVTFSHASANEMKERFEKLSGHVSLVPTFGTFHSVFLRILKSSGVSIRSIVSEKQKFDFMKTEIERYSIPYENITDLASDLLTQISKRKVMLDLSQKSRRGISKSATTDMLSGSVSADIFKQICQHYAAYLSREGLVDFDDMIIRCHDLLKSRPDILSRCQDTFKYILVDEFQDISPIQYDCIRMLAGTPANLFVVGDDDQSIYGFRGASPSIMKDFLRDYPSASQILLNVNYRCAACILKPALEVISANKNRFKKEITASYVSAASFAIMNFPTRNDEYIHMIPMIRGYLNNGLSVAVLFRNHADSALFLSMLSAHNVPFLADEKQPCIYEHFVIKDCLAYIRVGRSILEGRPESCRDSLVRIINKPSRYISRDSLLHGCFASMNAFYSSNSRMLARISKLYNDCRLVATLPPFAAIKYIRNVIGYDSWLSDFATEKHEDFTGYSWYLDELEELAARFKTFAEMDAAISAGSSAPAGINSPSQDLPCVQVMTMHHSKGLEFDAVFLPEINDSVIPNKKNLSGGGIEEERRLFYVAMTRARHHLFISYVGYLHNKTAHPSRFLDGLPPDG